MDTTLLDKAIMLAVKAHSGTTRKGNNLPYIIHPLEAVSIVATMTDDINLMAAAALHDVIEDTSYSYEDIAKEFGENIAEIVLAESDEKMQADERETWYVRKKTMIERLKTADRGVKIVALGDKLSNMRAIAADYERFGEDLWQKFHVKEKSSHAWHYRGLRDSLSDLKGEKAFEEFSALVDKVFPE